uniref:Uncharacterized protein n=1 Tax=Eiseniibacteriota bacterium TaxID=2212470 RepID=A0A832I5U9_UNCEI
MRARLGPALVLLLAVGLLGGCGGSNESITSLESPGAPSAAVEQREVSAVLAATPDLVDDGEFERPDEFSMSLGSPEALAAIRPLRWWRVINDVERRFEFAFADTDTTGRPTTAVVTIHKHLRGTFNIAAVAPPSDEALTGGPMPRPDSAQIIRKPLADHWVRRVLLKRVRLTPAGSPVWRAVASSGVDVVSRGATTDIKSLRVQAGPLDTTITDPLAFWWLRRMIRVQADSPVTLTVETGRDDDVVVLMSRGGRFPFRNNGDGTYSGVWRAPYLAGIRHVGVNALSRGTLFDDAAPYDSEAWILPYLVVGEPIAEYLP